MVAKGGHKLLEDDAVGAMVRELLPLALVVTPNLPEAEVLTGRTHHIVGRRARGGGADRRDGRARRRDQGRALR